MKVYFIYHRIAHHSDHSGYDQIVKYIPHKGLGPLWFRRLTGRLISPWQDRLLKDVPLAWYSKDRMAKELEAAGPFLTTVGHIYHYLYGEDLYYYLSRLPNWGRNRIVVSYHQPPSYFPKAVLRTEHIKKADAVIAVSKNQMDLFSKLVGRDRVFFVPHGVDTEFFQPLPHHVKDLSLDTKRCLFVGHWLRDMETLAKVISAFQSRGVDSVRFTIVTFEKYFDKFKNFKNIELLSGVSEDALLNLYQTSDLLFLPLTDCTANNTILEAMASGLPIVTTDVGGIRDYVDEKSAVLLPSGDVDAAVETLYRLLWDRERLSDLSQSARRRASDFSWPVVAAKMMGVYEKISLASPLMGEKRG